MKTINHKSGFTLIELMISTGIAAALVLIVMGTMKQSTSVTTNLERTAEVNELIQTITSELSRKEVCEKNFKTKIPSALSQNIGAITGRSGANIISAGANFGNYIMPVINISYSGVISSSKTTDNEDRLFKMDVVVNYQPKPESGKTIDPKEFTIPINVFLLPNGEIDTCYSDMQSLLENAVKYSCQGGAAGITANPAAEYFPKDAIYKYGHCEHQAEILDSSGTNVSSCPAGEFLKLIDTTNKRMTFKCEKFTTTTSCSAWSYMKGINSDGSADCVDIRTFFPTGNYAVVRASGTYQVQGIHCPPDQILQSISAAGTANCVNPRYDLSCGPGQFVAGINPDGTPNCQYASNKNACSGTSYMSAINSVGDVTCTAPALLGSCSGNDVITGIDSNGNVICSPNQP